MPPPRPLEQFFRQAWRWTLVDLARQLVAVLKPALFQLDNVVFCIYICTMYSALGVCWFFSMMHTRIKYVDMQEDMAPLASRFPRRLNQVCNSNWCRADVNWIWSHRFGSSRELQNTRFLISWSANSLHLLHFSANPRDWAWQGEGRAKRQPRDVRPHRSVKLDKETQKDWTCFELSHITRQEALETSTKEDRGGGLTAKDFWVPFSDPEDMPRPSQVFHCFIMNWTTANNSASCMLLPLEEAKLSCSL